MKKRTSMLLLLILLVALIGCVEDECKLSDQQRQKACLSCCGVDYEYGEAIKDRLQTGFLNYNAGYLAWLKWCDELYDVNAYYNVYGHRFTLDQYKRLMGAMFEQFEISLGGTGETAGEIGNIITDSVKGMTAIKYDVSFRKKATTDWVSISTIEFVQFRPDDQFGARVMEGWALSSAQIQPDQEVVAFWMNPANDWNALLARVATWDNKGGTSVAVK